MPIHEQFIPTCRYGHGPLTDEHAGTSPAPAAWGIMGMQSINNQLMMDHSVWTLKIYRCKTCGYLELFDLDVPKNDSE